MISSLPPADKVCSVCGVRAPETDSQYTLISSKYGWRLKREKYETIYLLNWFCSDCWKKEKLK